MNLLKFIFFSSLEYLTSFAYILMQFRFSLRENIDKILLISVLLSFVSYSFIEADLLGLSPLIQNVIFLIYIWMVLRVSLPNSLIMLITGYTVFGLVQSCYAAISHHLGWIEGEIKMGTDVAYTISIASSITMVLFSLSIYWLKGGFSFIESRSRLSNKPMERKHKFFVAYIILAFVITLIANIYMLNNANPPYLLVATILFIILIFIFYFTFKRDESVD